jgi:hypothetical protein
MNAMARFSNLKRSLKAAALSALVIAGSILFITVVRGLIDLAFDGKFHIDWPLNLKFAGVFGLVWFIAIFAWGLIVSIRSQPVLDILDEDPEESELLKKPLNGFVAMEFFWLILNRTYVVIISYQGLYGWRACGPVTNRNLNFFQPYQDMVDDPDSMRDLGSMQKLSRLRGGFFIDRSAIATVEVNDRPKWGMGGIPEGGRIVLRLNSNKTREFILLGSVYPDSIRDKIVLAPAASVK